MDNQNPAPNNAQGPQKNTLMAVLSYLGILVLIPFFTTKNDPFVKFHIKQGLVLLIVEVVISIIAHVVWVLWPLWNLANLATLILAIIGIVNAAKGREKELPWIGHWAAKFTF